MHRHVVIAAVVFASACAARAPQPDRSIAGASGLSVPNGSRLIFAGHAEGAQIYGCASRTDGGYEWKLKAPDAEVTSASGEKLRHYGGPTWEASDGSKVVGEVKARAQMDATALPWLLLAAKSTSGAGMLAKARWIQRVETVGGTAPANGCDPAHSGAETRIAYSATYRIWGN